MPIKSIVCDSSALISLADTCNVDAFKFLTANGLNFVITPVVREEIVNRPLTIKKYAFSASRLQKSITEGSLKLVESLTLHEQTKRILEIANNLVYIGNKPIELIQDGEAECLAIFASASAKALLVDEKTTRMLIENPSRLVDNLQSEYRDKPRLDEAKLAQFAALTHGIICMRSSELLAIAFEKGFFDEYKDRKQEAFKAAIYSLREAGCGLTANEIAEYEGMELRSPV
jgi:predicted nucleic acid-binding protein